ncbi:MAG: MFS transporter [Candidatus Bathyarchaeia archaeon]
MKSHRVLIVSSLEYVSFYLCRFNLAPVLPILMNYFKITHGEAGALASVIFISYAIALFPAGILGDRFGPKKVITLGAAISMLSSVSFPYTSLFSHALVIQFCNGFGQGMAWGPLTRLMSNWYPKEKMGFVMSVLSVPPAVGPVLAYVAAGYFATVYGWRTAFWYPSFALLVLTFFFWALVRDRPSGALEKRKGFSTKGRISSVASSRGVWLVAFAYLCLSACGRGILVWLPTYLTERAGLSLPLASILGGMVTLSGIGTMFFGTWLADVKLGGRKKVVIVLSFISAVPTMITLPYLVDFNWVLVAFGLTFAFLYFGGGLYFAYPPLLLPIEAVGTAAGLIDTLGYVGNFLGTLLIGLVFDAYHSYDPVFMILALVAIVGSAIASQLRE